jgi:hypothetical protein
LLIDNGGAYIDSPGRESLFRHCARGQRSAAT